MKRRVNCFTGCLLQKVALGIFLNPITPWPVSLVHTGRMVACAVAYLHPSVGREGEAFKLLAEELNHVCALGLAVNEDVQPKSFLFHDTVVVEEVQGTLQRLFSCCCSK